MKVDYALEMNEGYVADCCLSILVEEKNDHFALQKILKIRVIRIQKKPVYTAWEAGLCIQVFVYGFSLFKMSTQRVGILNDNPPASRVGATVAAYYQDNTHDKDCETQTFYSENKCEKCTINMVTKF